MNRQKVMKIEGMTCGHCQKRVEDILNDLPGIQARVDLAKKQAVISLDGSFDEETTRTAIEEAGYRVISITDQKGD